MTTAEAWWVVGAVGWVLLCAAVLWFLYRFGLWRKDQ